MSPEELKDAAKRQDWPAYFAGLRAARDAKAAEPELVAPPPEHTSRDPWPEDFAVPRAAAGLVKEAEAAGWVTQTSYSRGSVVCRRKEVGRVVERRHVVAVRLWHPGMDWHAVAVWESLVDTEKLAWKAETAKTWRPGSGPQEVGVTALKAFVKEEA